jgi:hypothetical protein
MLWLDADPPTWEWEHNPAFVPLRVARLAKRYQTAWLRFVNDPETRFQRFCNTDVWEPRS